MNLTVDTRDIEALANLGLETYVFYFFYLRKKADANGLIGLDQRFNATQAFLEIQDKKRFPFFKTFKLSVYLVRKMLKKLQNAGFISLANKNNRFSFVFKISDQNAAQQEGAGASSLASYARRFSGACLQTFKPVVVALDGLKASFDPKHQKTGFVIDGEKAPEITTPKPSNDAKPPAASGFDPVEAFQSLPRVIDPSDLQQLHTLRRFLYEYRIKCKIENLQSAEFLDLFKFDKTALKETAEALAALAVGDEDKSYNLRYFLTTLKNRAKSGAIATVKNEAPRARKEEQATKGAPVSLLQSMYEAAAADVSMLAPPDVKVFSLSPCAQTNAAVRDILTHLEVYAAHLGLNERDYSNRSFFSYAVMKALGVQLEHYRCFCVDRISGNQAEMEARNFAAFINKDTPALPVLEENKPVLSSWGVENCFSERIGKLRNKYGREGVARFLRITKTRLVSKGRALLELERWEKEDRGETVESLEEFNERLLKIPSDRKTENDEVLEAENQDQPIIESKPDAAPPLLIINDPAVANSQLDHWAKAESDNPSGDLCTQYIASYVLGANEWAAGAGLKFSAFPNRESFLFAVLKARGVGNSDFECFCDMVGAGEYQSAFVRSFALYLQDGRFFSSK